MEEIRVNGRIFRSDVPLTADIRAQVMHKVSSVVARSGCVSCGSVVKNLSPATCIDVVQNSTHNITLTATGGVPPYTYTLLLDGTTKAASGAIANTTWTTSATFGESVGPHTLIGQIVDSCGTPQTATDQCASFNITAPVTTGSIACTSTPSGAQLWLDGVNTNLFTPFTLTNVPAGTHTVIFRLSGYQDCSQSVTVTAGATANASCTLTPTCSALAAGMTISP